MVATLKKQNVLKELFGALPFKEPTEKILQDTRKDMEFYNTINK